MVYVQINLSVLFVTGVNVQICHIIPTIQLITYRPEADWCNMRANRTLMSSCHGLWHIVGHDTMWGTFPFPVGIGIQPLPAHERYISKLLRCVSPLKYILATAHRGQVLQSAGVCKSQRTIPPPVVIADRTQHRCDSYTR